MRANSSSDTGPADRHVANAGGPFHDEDPDRLGGHRRGLKIDYPLESQIEVLTELCRRGSAGQIVLSHDRHCTSDWFPEQGVVDVLPEWNYGYIQGSLLPSLRENGVTDDQIAQMTRRNPARVLRRALGFGRAGRGGAGDG